MIKTVSQFPLILILRIFLLINTSSNNSQLTQLGITANVNGEGSPLVPEHGMHTSGKAWEQYIAYYANTFLLLLLIRVATSNRGTYRIYNGHMNF